MFKNNIICYNSSNNTFQEMRIIMLQGGAPSVVYYTNGSVSIGFYSNGTSYNGNTSGYDCNNLSIQAIASMGRVFN